MLFDVHAKCLGWRKAVFSGVSSKEPSSFSQEDQT
jgi:hypothetical protein